MLFTLDCDLITFENKLNSFEKQKYLDAPIDAVYWE